MILHNPTAPWEIPNYKPYKYHGYTVRGTPNCPLTETYQTLSLGRGFFSFIPRGLKLLSSMLLQKKYSGGTHQAPPCFGPKCCSIDHRWLIATECSDDGDTMDAHTHHGTRLGAHHLSFHGDGDGQVKWRNER